MTKTVLIAVDDDEGHSAAAFEQALQFIDREKDRVLVVHLFEIDPLTSLKSTLPIESFQEQVRKLKEDHIKALSEVGGVIDRFNSRCKEAKLANFQVYMKECHSVKEALVGEVQASGAKFLVLGSRHKSPMENAFGFLGSVSEYCARYAPCNVIIFRRQ